MPDQAADRERARKAYLTINRFLALRELKISSAGRDGTSGCYADRLLDQELDNLISKVKRDARWLGNKLCEDRTIVERLDQLIRQQPAGLEDVSYSFRHKISTNGGMEAYLLGCINEINKVGSSSKATSDEEPADNSLRSKDSAACFFIGAGIGAALVSANLPSLFAALAVGTKFGCFSES